MEINSLREKVFPKILRFVALRARSKKEVVDRLNTYLKSFDNSAIEKENFVNAVIKEFSESNFINDSNLTRDLAVSLKTSTNARGKNYLKNYLIKKGVGKNDIEAAIQSIDDESEYERAKAWALKKLKTLKFQKTQEAKQKLWQQLMYRGFDTDVIGRVIDNVLGVK